MNKLAKNQIAITNLGKYNEGILSLMRIGEYKNIEALNEFFEAYENLEEYEKEAFAAMIEGYGVSHKEALERIESGDYTFYSGENLKDVAYALVDDGCFGDIPDSIANYIDYDSIAYDLEIDEYRETSKGVIHIF